MEINALVVVGWEDGQGVCFDHRDLETLRQLRSWVGVWAGETEVGMAAMSQEGTIAVMIR